MRAHRAFERVNIVAALQDRDDWQISASKRGDLRCYPFKVVVAELHRRERIVEMRIKASAQEDDLRLKLCNRQSSAGASSSTRL